MADRIHNLTSPTEDYDAVSVAAANDLERQHSPDKPSVQQLEDPLSTTNSMPVWKSLKAGDGDTALALFDNVEQLHEVVDPVEEKKLIRKIDKAILPCLAVCYAFYYASSHLQYIS